MSYTLSCKIGIIVATYFVNESQTSSQADLDKQQKDDILKATPELVSISDRVTLKELYARSRIISKLSEMAKNPEKTFGKVKSTMNAVGVNNAISNLKEVISGLTTDTNITNLGNKPISAWFKGWDGADDTNVAVISGTTMTYRKFLSNIINDSQLVASLFIGNEKAPESKDTEKIHQSTRLGTFLLALENKHPDAEYKTMFRQAHEKLGKGDTDGARDIVRKTLNKEWNINIDQQATLQGHANLLRAIGATHEAGQVTVSSAKELKKKTDSELKPEQQKLVAELGLRLPAEIQRTQPLAELKYQEMCDAIPQSDPYKAQVIRGKTEIITELANEKAYMNILDGYIGKNGPDGLGELYNVYNDMKGLKGFWNFSDENAKMTKEMAIMVASFALTAGIGPILSGIGIGARAIAGANTLRATKLAADAGRFRTGITAVSNGGKAVARGVLVGTARVAEAGVAVNDAAQAGKLTRIPGEALKFTTADALIHEATRGAGDQSGFKDFANKLALNGVMFGAFSGMEKFVSGPTLSTITKQFGIENAVATFALNGIVLTAGDIGVMQALHAAETGKFEWDWMSAYQALAFRIGMKGAEKTLPNLSAKFQNSKIGNNLVQKAEMQKNGIAIVDGKRVSLGVASKSTLESHGKLDPQARIAKAEELLGRKLNEVEQGVLMKAHEIPMGNNIQKGKILMSEGKFSRQEAEILMDKGIAGKGVLGAPEGTSSPRVAVENTVPQLISRDNLATSLKNNRYQKGVSRENIGIPEGKIELTVGESLTVTRETYKSLQKEYNEAMKIESADARATKLAEIDTRFAERLILDNGRKIEVGSRDKAQEIINGLGSTPGYKNLQIQQEANGLYSVSRIPRDRSSNLAELAKFEKGIKSTRPDSPAVVESPVSSQSVEFSAPGGRYTYKVELLPNGEHIVKVKSKGDKEWRIAETPAETSMGSSQNYNERIALEVQGLKDRKLQLSVQPKEIATPQNQSRSELQQLQDRREEILAWKKENPGNIRYDADLMVTETAIAKIHTKESLGNNSQRTENSPIEQTVAGNGSQLRQERIDMRNELRSQRAAIENMTPEARKVELDRIKKEAEQLIGRRGDLANRLEATKDKIDYDERRAIEKSIEELDKKILANKRLQNSFEKSYKEPETPKGIIKEPETPKGIIKEPETPKGIIKEPEVPKEIVKDPSKLKDWMKSVGLGIGALVIVGGALYLIDKNKKDEPVLIPAPAVPSSVSSVAASTSPSPVSSSPATSPGRPRNPNAFNEQSLEKYKDRILIAIKELTESNDPKKVELGKQLKETFVNKFSRSDVTKLQQFMIDNWSESTVSNDKKPDGLFGDMTMKAIEDIVKTKPASESATAPAAAPPAPVQAPAPAAAPPAPVQAPAPIPAIETPPTIQMKPREIGDLIITLMHIENGYSENNHTVFFLNSKDIKILSELSPANIKYMKDQLTQESNLDIKNMTAQEKTEHKKYWQGYSSKLDFVIKNYNGELKNIKRGPTKDLELLGVADKKINELKNSIK